MRRGLLPTGIPTSMRDDYYEALENADRGAWGDLAEMLATLQLSVITRVRSIAEEPEQRTEWVERLSQAASQRLRDTRHKQYTVWRYRVEDLAARFESVASEIDQSTDLIGATLKRYSPLEFSRWLQVAEEGYFTRTWQFGLLFFAEGKPVWRCVFYARQHQWVAADPTEIPHGTVALYLAGQDATADAPLDILHFDDPHVTLRELVYVDGGLFRYRINPEGELVCDDEITAADAVKDLFEEVFGRKLGLPI